MPLIVPKFGVPVPKHPSYEVLDMAFGVGAGTQLFDKSIYRSHGDIITATWAAGLHGMCLNFVPGNPDYVEIPAAHTHLNFIAEDFSIVTRVNINNFALNRLLFCRGLGNTDGYWFQLISNGAIQFSTNNAPARQTSAAAPGSVVIGNWYTLGMSRTGASVRIYNNGLDVTTVVGVHVNPLTCARNARIGIYDNLAAEPMSGRMEFLRILRGVALQPSEHLAWHNALA